MNQKPIAKQVAIDLFRSMVQMCNCNKQPHMKIAHDDAKDLLTTLCQFDQCKYYWEYLGLIDATIIFFKNKDKLEWKFAYDITEQHFPLLKLDPFWFDLLFVGEIGDYYCEEHSGNYYITSKSEIIYHIILIRDNIIIDLTRICIEYMLNIDNIPNSIINDIRYVLTKNTKTFKFVKSKLIYCLKYLSKFFN